MMKNLIRHSTTLHTTYLSPPTLVVRDGIRLPPEEIRTKLFGFRYKESMENKEKRHEERKRCLLDSFEYYTRMMVSKCATNILIPKFNSPEGSFIKKHDNALSPSVVKRIKWVDKLGIYWDSISSYLKPVVDRFDEDDLWKDPDLSKTIDDIAWHLYFVVLAVKKESEIALWPAETIYDINWLRNDIKLSGECLMRLAVIEGIFELFNQKQSIPTLAFLSKSDKSSIFERVDEIMEDAYMLEASRLRRFFGFKSNVASIKRDLKKLTNFIVSNKKWAKGILGLGSQLALFNADQSKVIEKLSEIIPDPSNICFTPIFIAPGTQYQGVIGQNDLVVEDHRGIGSEYWIWETSANFYLSQIPVHFPRFNGHTERLGYNITL